MRAVEFLPCGDRILFDRVQKSDQIQRGFRICRVRGRQVSQFLFRIVGTTLFDVEVDQKLAIAGFLRI